MAAIFPASPGFEGTYSVPQVIDQVWQYVSNLINSGQINNIIQPSTFKRIIGQQGFDIIATRYRHLIQAPVAMFDDPKDNAIHIIPTRNPEGKIISYESPEAKTPVVKKAKIPRPPNAFILYRQHHHPLIKAKHPEMHNNQISIILGTQWKDEDPKTREHFKAMAEAIKKKHLSDHPEYSYQPRKPTERKRRMTRRKAAVLSELSAALYTPITGTPKTAASSSIESPSSYETSPLSVVLPPYTKEQFLEELPELEKTAEGNPIIELGEEYLHENKLRWMLEAHNSTVNTPAPTPQQLFDPAPPIIFSEPTEEARESINFYSAMIDWNVIDRESEAIRLEMQALFDAANRDNTMTLIEQTRAFDIENESLFTAELNRMKDIFD